MFPGLSNHSGVVLEIATSEPGLITREAIGSGRVNVSCSLPAIDGAQGTVHVPCAFAAIRDGGQLGSPGEAGGHPMHLFKAVPEHPALEALHNERTGAGLARASGVVFEGAAASVTCVVLTVNASHDAM